MKRNPSTQEQRSGPPLQSNKKTSLLLCGNSPQRIKFLEQTSWSFYKKPHCFDEDGVMAEHNNQMNKRDVARSHDRDLKLLHAHEQLAKELAKGKAQSLLGPLRKSRDELRDQNLDVKVMLLASDTVVANGKKTYGKPMGRDHAKQVLKELCTAKVHQVISGLALILLNEKLELIDECYLSATTNVEFADFDEALIEFYLDSEEYIGVAGSYAIQGIAQHFIRGIEGSLSNVIGMPLVQFHQGLMSLMGIEIPWRERFCQSTSFATILENIKS